MMERETTWITFNTFGNGNHTGLLTPNNQRVKRGRVTDSVRKGQKESDKAAATHIKSSHVGGGGKKARVPRRKERWRWGRDSDVVWQD